MLEEILQEIKEMEYPAQGIGCGLEDEDITDRYDAAAYGFVVARERIAEIIRGYGEEDGWIPCSERMPENDGFYLATIDGEIAGEDKPFSGLAEFENGKWIDDEEDYQCIIAWQPLPEPYRPGQKTVGEDYKQQIMGRFLRQD